MSKRKQSERSYDEKFAIIKYSDAHQSMKKKDIAEHFGINQGTLCGILKNREKIISACSGEDKRVSVHAAKRIRAITHPDVDKALITWFRQKALIPDIRLDAGMLLIQANKFRQMFNPDDTDAITPSWVERFKQRYGIVKIKKAGESAGVDQEIIRVWKDGQLQDILNRYKPCDIYNADETGLFWKMLPENSLGFAGQSHHGKKEPKSRVTLLVGANMQGSDKLPLLVIGKSAKPRAFNNVKVPVTYLANKKA
jgi:hypothetical protein